jgi:protein-L-isoaspartate O-methyltransferase
MPYSTPVFKNETIDYLVNKFDLSSTILDVGAGAGYYSK